VGEGQVYKNFKRLQDARDAREATQKLWNAYDKNKISKGKARTLGYLIKVFLDTYELTNLQEEIEEIREILDNRKMKGA